MAIRKPRRRADRVTLEPEAEPCASVLLGESLDLVAAAPLSATLLALRGGNLALDASAVRRLGGQCLQILLAAQGAWQTDGYSLTITSPSADFVDTAALLGVEPAAATLYGL